MIRYILKRLLFMVPMLLGITFLTYLVISLSPGGPAAGLVGDLNPKISAEYREKLIKHHNFDKPILVQYANWLGRVVRLDFGTSFKDDQPVIKKIWERLPKTLLLTGLSLIFSFIIAMAIGIFSAMKQNTWWDRVLTVFVFLGFSIPTYWIALLLMIFFGIQLGWLPMTGFESVMADTLSWPRYVLDVAHHLILPVSIISLTSLAGLSRNARYAMLEVIRQDYIRTARAKGLPEKRVIMVHALRNSLITVITILGFTLPDLISAGVIIETIFSYPGLGRLAYEAAVSKDTFLIMPTVLFAAFLTLLGNLVADILYAFADPRIRYK